jgi:Tol biopolymer transport system component
VIRTFAAAMVIVLVGALAACSHAIPGAARPSVDGLDYADAHLVWTTAAPNLAVADLAFSPDGRLLAVADSNVTVWDVVTHRLVATLPCDGAPAPHTNATAFSPDGHTLAMAGVCGPNQDSQFSLQLFDLASRRLVATLPDNDDGAYFSLAFSPDGRTLLAAGDATASMSVGAVVDYYDPVGEQLSASATTQYYQIDRMALSPGGRTMVVAEPSIDDQPDDNAVQLLDVATRQVTATLTGQESNAVTFSPDGRLVAATIMPDSVQLWNVATHALVRTLVSVGHNAAVPFMSMAFSPDGRILVVGDDGGELTFFDVASGRQVGMVSCGCGSALLALAYNRDGSVLAAGTGDSQVVLWTP